MNSRVMDGTGSSSRAARRRPKSNFKKKSPLPYTAGIGINSSSLGSLCLASFILFGCCVCYADEKADAVTRAPPLATGASISTESGTVASLTSTASPADRAANLLVTKADRPLDDVAQKTSADTPSLITSTVTYEATTRFDAEWSAELFESDDATSTGPPLSSTEPGSTAMTWTTAASAAVATAGPPVKSPSSWPWLVFVLTGNSTVAGRRQRDLGTYLRLNLAARLDADYNDVAINRILLSPHSVLANISVEPSHLLASTAGSAGLEALGQGNVTLLELSGTEFQVERIIRFDEALDQREMMNLEMASVVATVGSEVTVYGAVGAVFLFLLVALLLGLSFNSPCRNSSSRSGGDTGGAKYLSDNGYDRDQADAGGQELVDLRCVSVTVASPSCPPPVIYSEQLAREMCDSASLLPRAHFIPSWSPASDAGQQQQRYHHQPDRRRAHCKPDQASDGADHRHSPC